MRALHLTRENLPHFEARIDRITSGSQRRWGKMEPPELFAHLTRALLLSLGKLEMPDQSNIFTRTAMRWVAFETPLPWMRGLTAPKAFFDPDPASIETERLRLKATMAEFVKELEWKPDRVVNSPIFGPMTLTYWAKVNGRHFEHHLQQYGV